MAKAELSQEELDALLEQSAIETESSDDAAATLSANESVADASASVQLGRQPRIVRTPLPGLELIHDAAIRYLQNAFAQFTGQICVVTGSAAKTETYGDFIARQPVPASLNVLALKPLYGHLLLVLQPQLLFAMIDALFGGNGRFPAHIEGREFSPSESRVIQRIVGHFCAEYARAWQPVMALELELKRSEMRVQAVEIAKLGEMMISFDITVAVGSASGLLSLCIPCSSLEPIRDKLNQAPQSIVPGSDDHKRIDLLADQIKGASVELVAELAQGSMTVAELIALKVGDFVEFDLREMLIARIGRVPVLRCGYGVSSGRYALRVQEILTGNGLKQRESHHVN